MEAHSQKGHSAGSKDKTTPAEGKRADAAPLFFAADLAQALELLQSGKHKEAEEALTALLPSVQAANHLGALRTIKSSLAALEAYRTEPAEDSENTALQATFLLNRQEGAEAIKLLETTVASAGTPDLFYLMALAQAQENNPEISAEWLKKAVDMDDSFLNLFRLEPDFEHVRNHEAFDAFDEE